MVDMQRLEVISIVFSTRMTGLKRAYMDTHLSKHNKLLVNHMLSVSFVRFVLFLCMGVWFALVYSKAHLKNPDTIVRYLGRYTRKIAISESRIRSVNARHVIFDYKDYKVNCEAREGALGCRDGKNKHLQLSGCEFLRRFLLHILPQGFMRIRHYGFLSNRNRRNS